MVEEVEEEVAVEDEEKLATDFFLDSNEVVAAEPVFVQVGKLSAKKRLDLREERNREEEEVREEVGFLVGSVFKRGVDVPFKGSSELWGAGGIPSMGPSESWPAWSWGVDSAWVEGLDSSETVLSISFN